MLFSKIIKKQFDKVLGRYEEDPALYFFSLQDFPGLIAESYDIQGAQGKLRGYFYYYKEFNCNKFIIFDHGIGAGHRAYLKEIELLCHHGYTVYSYDHTGCVDSEGPGILAFSQGVNDLDHVITNLEHTDRLKDATIKLIGHSWGGYSSMNVVAFHPEVTHVVSLAGFLSAKALEEQYLPNIVKKYSVEVMDREREINPDYADLDARDSLLKSKAALLHIQSRDDKMVKFNLCTPLLQKALEDRKRTQFVLTDNRGHGPQLSDKAAKLYGEMNSKYEELKKHKKLETKAQQDEFRNSQDWKAITTQDPIMWNKIIRFLES